MRTNKVKIGRTLVIGALVAVLFAFFPSMGLADLMPTATMVYNEPDGAGGIWRYNYTVTNTSSDPNNPLAYEGVNLFIVSLHITGLPFIGVTPPTDWEKVIDTDFVDVVSVKFGAPPDGSNIPPGFSLEDFIFDFSAPVGSLVFDATFVNPKGEGRLYYLDGNTAPISPPVPAPVPEPATIILMTTGMGVLGLLGKKGIRKPRA